MRWRGLRDVYLFGWSRVRPHLRGRPDAGKLRIVKPGRSIYWLKTRWVNGRRKRSRRWPS